VLDYRESLDRIKRAYDAAEFKESEHPRKDDGKFGKGAGGAGGAGGASATAEKPSMPKGMEHVTKGSHKTVASFAKALITENKYSNDQIAKASQVAFGGKTSPACIAYYKTAIKNESPEGKAAAAAKKAGVASNNEAVKKAAAAPAPQTAVDASYKKAEDATAKTVYVSAKDSDGKPQFIKLSGVPDGLDNLADLKDTLKKNGYTVSVVGAFDPAKPAPPGGYKDIALHPHDAQLAKDAKYAKQEAAAKAAAESKSADAPITELHTELTQAEVKAIKAYTDGAYKALNQQLRKGQPMTAEQYTTAARLDTALAKAKIAKDTFVYRGLGDAAEKFFGPKPVIGTTIIDNGYISTAKTKEKAWGGAKCSIAVKKGQNGMDVQSRSLHPGEKEVMLPRGSMFRITGVSSSGMVELEYVSG
jgi:hypothetical protein